MADRTRKQRFFQEAKAASAPNHPNNIIIHDVHSSDNLDFTGWHRNQPNCAVVC